MNATDHLGLYAEGWTNGDANLILQAVTDNYVFDDPNVGVISKSNFSEYFEEMKNTVRALRGGNLPEPFMELSEVVTTENNGTLTAWCWWVVPGTEIKGSGLIKVESSGVCSEVITYYAKPGS